MSSDKASAKTDPEQSAEKPDQTQAVDKTPDNRKLKKRASTMATDEEALAIKKKLED